VPPPLAQHQVRDGAVAAVGEVLRRLPPGVEARLAGRCAAVDNVGHRPGEAASVNGIVISHPSSHRHGIHRRRHCPSKRPGRDCTAASRRNDARQSEQSLDRHPIASRRVLRPTPPLVRPLVLLLRRLVVACHIASLRLFFWCLSHRCTRTNALVALASLPLLR
jgi:hypothetical protein